MTKTKSKEIISTQKTVNYDNNLLTFAERKYFELLDSEKFREIYDNFEFLNVDVVKKGKKITTIPKPQSMYEKISRVKNEVEDVKKLGDGQWEGVVIAFNVIKKGFQKLSKHEVVVAYVGEELIYSRK